MFFQTINKIIQILQLDEKQNIEAKNLIEALYKILTQKDASLIEINPLVITGENNIICLDAQVNFDSNALFRHPEYQELIDPS